ncbi:unnamed protein product [Rotaria socialis]|uniref:Uncharacterized protein n=1 Tax=Rotaria socialis TaxID=392032 RepID=A0A821HNU9_9BILA|nr:unnamed protein product [Rotaria socialis]
MMSVGHWLTGPLTADVIIPSVRRPWIVGCISPDRPAQTLGEDTEHAELTEGFRDRGRLIFHGYSSFLKFSYSLEIDYFGPKNQIQAYRQVTYSIGFFHLKNL